MCLFGQLECMYVWRTRMCLFGELECVFVWRTRMCVCLDN